MLSIVPRIDDFPQTRLGMKLHRGKTHVVDVRQGIEFLGAFVKPYRTYISNKTVVRMRQTLNELNTHDKVARVVEFDDDLLKSKPKTRNGAKDIDNV